MAARFELNGTIGLLTLADPTQRNALSRALVEDALALLRTGSAGARALVVTGEGHSFCAGANIHDLLGAGWMSADPAGATPMDLFEAIDREPRVTIAAAAGLVLGGGFELSLCCDLVVAADDAQFALPELGLGVMPNTGLARLAQIVGSRRALEMILTRRRIPAAEALDLGIVNRVVPRADLLEAATALAREITDAAPPGAITAIKAAMRGAAPLDWPAIRAVLGTLPVPEWTEGLSAFAERRRPDYGSFWQTSGAPV